MYKYYRMTGSRQLMALYRCEHCGKVALHPVKVSSQLTYNDTFTRSGLERRRERKTADMNRRLDRIVASLTERSSVWVFPGRTLEGACPHCNKKQSWMRMSYRLWASFAGILAMLLAFGALSLVTFEGSRSSLHTLQTVVTALAAVFALTVLGLVIHAAVMLLRTSRSMKDTPVILARSAEELAAKAAAHPELLKSALG